MNCDWIPNTSRENIPYNSWNRTIRDSLAKFFVWIVINNSFVKSHIGHFINQSLHDEWWNIYRSSIISLLEKYLFQVENGKQIKFVNNRIDKLVNSSVIEQYTNIIVKDPIKVNSLSKFLGNF